VQSIVASANLLTDRSDSTHEGDLDLLNSLGVLEPRRTIPVTVEPAVYICLGPGNSIKSFRSEVDAAGVVLHRVIRPESKLAVSDHVAVCL